MIFGYSTNAYVRFSLMEALDRIAALGFRGVEIMGDQPHLYPGDYPEERLYRVAEKVRSCGLKITNLNSFTLFAVGDTHLPSWIEANPQVREVRIQHTLDCLKAAHALGCPSISVPPGGPLEHGSRREALALFHAGLERVIPTAEAWGIKLLVEPEPELLLENTPQFQEFIADVRSPIVGINFDMGHFFCAGEDPARSFETLLPWIGHIHLEDIAASRVHRHLIPGLGAIDFPKTLGTIKASGYDGDISLELYPYVDRPDEAGQQSREYLQSIFDELGWTL